MPQKEILLYYAFASPAVLVGVFFSLSLLTNGSSISHELQIPLLGIPIATALELVALGFGFFSLIKRNILILSILPVISFFLYMAGYGEQLRVSPLPVGLVNSIVFVSTLSALASFRYSRAAELSRRGRPILQASGPIGYTILNHVLDFVFPLLIVIFLTLTIIWSLSALKEVFNKIPGPLSSIAVEYLSTSIGQATFGVLVFGSIMWIIKQFIEPFLLNYSLLPNQALALLLSEEEGYHKLINAKELKIKGSRGWLILSVSLFVITYGLILYFNGPEYLTNTLNSTFGRTPIVQGFDRFVYDGFNSIADRLTGFVLQGENLIRIILKMLFG